MYKKISGYCPIQGKIYSIFVEYIDASDLSEAIYCKGRAKCDYNKSGDKCDPSKCPIIELAPENL